MKPRGGGVTPLRSTAISGSIWSDGESAAHDSRLLDAEAHRQPGDGNRQVEDLARTVLVPPLGETLGEADLSGGMKDFCGDEGDG